MNRGILYLIFTALFFGSFEVVSKLISGIEPVLITFYRFLFGGLFILPFALREIKKKKIVINKKVLLSFFWQGILFVPVSMVLLQTAIQNSSAALVAFVFSTTPIFIAIFAFLILKEKPNKYIVGAILLGITGLSILTDVINSSLNWHISCAILASVLFSFYIVSMRKANRIYGNLIPFAITVFFGTLILFIYLVIVGAPLAEGVSSNLSKLLYIGVVCSGLLYISYFRGMELTSTNMGSIIFFLKPIVATILAVLILEEEISQNFIFGALLVILSSVSMFYGKQKNKVISGREEEHDIKNTGF